MSGIAGATTRVERVYSRYRVAFTTAGVLAILAGLVILFWPSGVLRVFAIVVGIYAIAMGVFYLVMGIMGNDLSKTSRTIRIVGGAVALLVGVLALVYMDRTDDLIVLVLGLGLGILWLTEGVITLMSAIRSKNASVASLVIGVLAVIAGAAMILLPLYQTATILKWVFGLSFVLLGIAQIYRVYSVTRVVKAIGDEATLTIE
ncbi:DUF308 domain-containing protein [Actinomycetaceae bacterium MB13-C1-2]|nr:DUF308 domain-containing protein [Actinomycetaceae bacterium MB13-C1-2]